MVGDTHILTTFTRGTDGQLSTPEIVSLWLSLAAAMTHHDWDGCVASDILCCVDSPDSRREIRSGFPDSMWEGLPQLKAIQHILKKKILRQINTSSIIPLTFGIVRLKWWRAGFRGRTLGTERPYKSYQSHTCVLELFAGSSLVRLGLVELLFPSESVLEPEGGCC